MAPNQAEAIVNLDGVEKRFSAGGAMTPALSGINLRIRPGEFVSLIGPSGCGKSTLLRIIGDLIEPTAGTVEVNGKPARNARQDRDYGMVFQAPVLFDWRTIEANVELPLEVMGVPHDQRRTRTEEMLALVELSEFGGHHPWQLSGGMQQRAAIARALAFEPKLLLMDEPFGALDEIVRDNLNLQLLRLWHQTRKTVLFVTHSIPEAVFLSTRIVVMSPRPGRIIDIIDCDFPRDRSLEIRETPEFLKIAQRVRTGLREGHSYDE